MYNSIIIILFIIILVYIYIYNSNIESFYKTLNINIKSTYDNSQSNSKIYIRLYYPINNIFSYYN